MKSFFQRIQDGHSGTRKPTHDPIPTYQVWLPPVNPSDNEARHRLNTEPLNSTSNRRSGEKRSSSRAPRAPELNYGPHTAPSGHDYYASIPLDGKGTRAVTGARRTTTTAVTPRPYPDPALHATVAWPMNEHPPGPAPPLLPEPRSQRVPAPHTYTEGGPNYRHWDPKRERDGRYGEMERERDNDAMRHKARDKERSLQEHDRYREMGDDKGRNRGEEGKDVRGWDEDRRDRNRKRDRDKRDRVRSRDKDRDAGRDGRNKEREGGRNEREKEKEKEKEMEGGRPKETRVREKEWESSRERDRKNWDVRAVDEREKEKGRLREQERARVYERRDTSRDRHLVREQQIARKLERDPDKDAEQKHRRNYSERKKESLDQNGKVKARDEESMNNTLGLARRDHIALIGRPEVTGFPEVHRRGQEDERLYHPSQRDREQERRKREKEESRANEKRSEDRRKARALDQREHGHGALKDKYNYLDKRYEPERAAWSSTSIFESQPQARQRHLPVHDEATSDSSPQNKTPKLSRHKRNFTDNEAPRLSVKGARIRRDSVPSAPSDPALAHRQATFASSSENQALNANIDSALSFDHGNLALVSNDQQGRVRPLTSDTALDESRPSYEESSKALSSRWPFFRGRKSSKTLVPQIESTPSNHGTSVKLEKLPGHPIIDIKTSYSSAFKEVASQEAPIPMHPQEIKPQPQVLHPSGKLYTRRLPSLAVPASNDLVGYSMVNSRSQIQPLPVAKDKSVRDANTGNEGQQPYEANAPYAGLPHAKTEPPSSAVPNATQLPPRQQSAQVPFPYVSRAPSGMPDVDTRKRTGSTASRDRVTLANQETVRTHDTSRAPYHVVFPNIQNVPITSASSRASRPLEERPLQLHETHIPDLQNTPYRVKSRDSSQQLPPGASTSHMREDLSRGPQGRLIPVHFALDSRNNSSDHLNNADQHPTLKDTSFTRIQETPFDTASRPLINSSHIPHSSTNLLDDLRSSPLLIQPNSIVINGESTSRPLDFEVARPHIPRVFNQSSQAHTSQPLERPFVPAEIIEGQMSRSRAPSMHQTPGQQNKIESKAGMSVSDHATKYQRGQGADAFPDQKNSSQPSLTPMSPTQSPHPTLLTSKLAFNLIPANSRDAMSRFEVPAPSQAPIVAAPERAINSQHKPTHEYIAVADLPSALLHPGIVRSQHSDTRMVVSVEEPLPSLGDAGNIGSPFVLADRTPSIDDGNDRDGRGNFTPLPTTVPKLVAEYEAKSVSSHLRSDAGFHIPRSSTALGHRQFSGERGLRPTAHAVARGFAVPPTPFHEDVDNTIRTPAIQRPASAMNSRHNLQDQPRFPNPLSTPIHVRPSMVPSSRNADTGNASAHIPDRQAVNPQQTVVLPLPASSREQQVEPEGSPVIYVDKTVAPEVIKVGAPVELASQGISSRDIFTEPMPNPGHHDEDQTARLRTPDPAHKLAGSLMPILSKGRAKSEKATRAEMPVSQESAGPASTPNFGHGGMNKAQPDQDYSNTKYDVRHHPVPSKGHHPQIQNAKLAELLSSPTPVLQQPPVLLTVKPPNEKTRYSPQKPDVDLRSRAVVSNTAGVPEHSRSQQKPDLTNLQAAPRETSAPLRGTQENHTDAYLHKHALPHLQPSAVVFSSSGHGSHSHVQDQFQAISRAHESKTLKQPEDNTTPSLDPPAAVLAPQIANFSPAQAFIHGETSSREHDKGKVLHKNTTPLPSSSTNTTTVYPINKSSAQTPIQQLHGISNTRNYDYNKPSHKHPPAVTSPTLPTTSGSSRFRAAETTQRTQGTESSRNRPQLNSHSNTPSTSQVDLTTRHVLPFSSEVPRSHQQMNVSMLPSQTVSLSVDPVSISRTKPINSTQAASLIPSEPLPHDPNSQTSSASVHASQSRPDITLPQSSTNNSSRVPAPVPPKHRDVTRKPSEDSILLKTPSSLAPTILKPSVSRTSIPASFSSQTSSRRRGLFSMFKSKTAQPPEELQKPVIERNSHKEPRMKTTDLQDSKVTSVPSSRVNPLPPIAVPILVQPSGRKSPNSKVFTPFRYLTSKRNRRVSAASLEAQDGTAPNTVIGSPTTSLHSSQPPPIQLPSSRDAFVATQEWRHTEAAGVREVTGGKLRRARPGVVFDVAEDPMEEKRRKIKPKSRQS